MSLPANRLAKYRTYSYYHVLCLCDSTATADAIASEDRADSKGTVTNVNNIVDRYLHPTDDRYEAKTIQLPNGQGQGKYVVLINGSTDAEFVISTFRWTAMSQASVTVDNRFNAMAVEGQMEISEPRGVIFMKRIAEACATVGVSADSVVFFVKTFFIGHRFDPENGSDTIDYVANITPLKFLMLDIVSEFTFTGGTYSIELMSIYNGASRLPQYSGLKGVSVNVNGSLENAFQQLQDSVQRSYANYKKCVFAAYNNYIEKLKQQARLALVYGTGDLGALGDPGQLPNPAPTTVPSYPSAEDTFGEVEYRFELDPIYINSKDAKKEPLYKIDDRAQQQSNKAACDKTDATVQNAIGEGLEQMIDKLMDSCSQVKKDVQGKNPEKQKRGYRTHTKIESVPAGLNSDGSPRLRYIVTYRVIPFINVKNNTIESVLKSREGTQSNTGIDPSLTAQLQRNTIEFDYIYSGKNIDILDFNMKQQMSYSFLTTFTAPDSLKVQGRKTQQIGRSVNTQSFGSDVTKYRSLQQPLYFGAHIQSPRVVNAQSSYDAAAYHVAFTKWASLEALDAKVRITGNTQLLSSTARDTSVARPTTTVPDDATLYDWGTFPALAKINVYMPASDDDIAAFKGNERYATKFWYDSYYYIISIDHIFQDGSFEQELEMISLPYKVADDEDSPDEATQSFAEAYKGCDEVPPKSLNCSDTAKNATERTNTIAFYPVHKQTVAIASDNHLPMTDAEKQRFADSTPPILRVKPGSDAEGGGNTHPAVKVLAQIVQNSVNQFVYFTAFNDKFHQELPSSHSRHKVGLALDFTVANIQYAEAAFNFVVNTLAGAGLALHRDVTVLDEYNHPSLHATAGHIHADFHSIDIANKFLAYIGQQGVAAPMSGIDPAKVTTPPTNTSTSPDQKISSPKASDAIASQKKNCGDDQDKKPQKDAVCEPGKRPEEDGPHTAS